MNIMKAGDTLYEGRTRSFIMAICCKVVQNGSKTAPRYRTSPGCIINCYAAKKARSQGFDEYDI